MDDGGENLLSETRELSFSILDPPPDGLFSIMGSSSTQQSWLATTIMMMMVNMTLQLLTQGHNKMFLVQSCW